MSYFDYFFESFVLLETSFSEILFIMLDLVDFFSTTIYPDLTYGLFGNLTWSSVSVGSRPAAFVASINSFNDGSKIHFSFESLLPFFLGNVLLK